MGADAIERGRERGFIEGGSRRGRPRDSSAARDRRKGFASRFQEISSRDIRRGDVGPLPESRDFRRGDANRSVVFQRDAERMEAGLRTSGFFDDEALRQAIPSRFRPPGPDEDVEEPGPAGEQGTTQLGSRFLRRRGRPGSTLLAGLAGRAGRTLVGG